MIIFLIDLDLLSSQTYIFNFNSMFYFLEMILNVLEQLKYLKTNNTILELGKYLNIEPSSDDIEETSQYIIREYVSNLKVDDVNDKRIILILTLLYHKIFEKDIKGPKEVMDPNVSDCNDIFADCASIEENYDK